MKMYLLILDEVPLGIAIVVAAHASLAAYLAFQEHPDTRMWIGGPFKKVVCRIDAREWELAKAAGDFVILTESSLEGREVAIAFRPRAEWPKCFRFFRLFG